MAPPSIDRSLIRPRRVWYWVAGLVLAAGIAGAVLLGISAAGSIEKIIDDPLSEFTAPGEVRLRLEKGDRKGIYLHTQGSKVGIVGESVIGTDDVGCRVTGPGGRDVSVDTVFGDITISRRRDEYYGLFKFEAPESGTYRLRCVPRTQARSVVPLALGPQFEIFSSIASVFGAVLALLAGVLSALVIVGVTAFLRYRSGQRLRREAGLPG